MNPVLKMWNRLSAHPGGKWLFTRAVNRRAPYFASIPARFESLSVGSAALTLRDRRRVHNHIGTVHAIAMCNAAELSGGIATEVSVPKGMRWIPKGMTVRYLKPARGTLRVEASLPAIDSGATADVPVSVTVTDGGGDTVFTAEITMYVSPAKTAGEKVKQAQAA